MAPSAKPSPQSIDNSTGEETSLQQSERFENVTFDSTARSGEILGWTVPVLSGTVLVAIVLAGAHSIYTESDVVSLAGREVDVLNVMYGLALLFVGVLVVNTISSPRARRGHLLAELRSRRLLLACAVYAVGLFLVGSVAPFVFSEPDLQILVSIQPPVWSSISEVFITTCEGAVVDGQCQGTFEYPLGTNAAGQDLLTINALGLNTTLQVAVTASVLAGTLGTVVGILAGYYGGWLDELLMRYVDIQRALPAFFVYVLLILLFKRSYPLMILVFGLLSWGGIARLVRSDVKQLRTTPFVRAARISGAGRTTVIRRHVLPALTGTVLTALAVLFAKFVVYEAALAYLSLTDSSVTSLGNELAKAIGRAVGDPVGNDGGTLYDWWVVPWPVYIPTGILFSLLLAVSLLGDRLQDILDPRI